MTKAITIYPAVYVLELEGGNYYVGMSHNLSQRLAQHFSGNGAKWTKLHKPSFTYIYCLSCARDKGLVV